MDAHDGCINRFRTAVGVGLIVVCLGGVQVRAATPTETMLDAVALAQMEAQADRAKPQDQCYMYIELLHGLTELAGRQMAAGQDDAAGQTVVRMDEVMAKVQHVSSRNAKRLRNAEELMDHTARRLSDMARVASGDERDAMQAALKKMNGVHTAILTMVFQQ